MPVFLALLNHVHNILSPTLHTPILLIAQPAWTAKDHEELTQFFFEKFKTPAFCIMDSALAVTYGYGVQNATVIDIGYQKVDITAVTDFTVHHVGRTAALPNAGGDAMTQNLLKLLSPRGFTYDMCEQLKKSPFCEILSTGTPLPGEADTEPQVTNPAAAASTGALSSGPNVKITEPPRGIDVDMGEDELDGDKVIDDDGVLDVASIVASGKTQEFLAAQEKKKAAAAGRKAAKDARDAAEAAAAKPTRLPNSKREKIMFHYQERKTVDEVEGVNGNGKRTAEEEQSEPKRQKTPEAEPVPAPAPTSVPSAVEGEAAPAPVVDGEAAPGGGDAAPVGDEAAPEVTEAPSAEPAAEPATVAVVDPSVSVEDQAAKREQARAAKREEKRKARENQGDPGSVRKEIEVGVERFMAAGDGLMEKIADAVHRTILSSDDISKRSDLWDSLIIVGNGCRIRGFKDSLLATLNSRYLISPSSATIFTSELPSNLSTPMGTGAQTPQREYPPGQHPLPTGSSVNPLLLAATTASMQNPNMSIGSSFGAPNGHTHSSHSQSPTSIKTVKAPEYFPEFKVRRG